MCTNGMLPRNLIISQAVTFADGTLTVNLPAGSYDNGCIYSIVVAQAIPDETTINAPVVITVGEGTAEYPLIKCSGVQVTAASLRTRTRYPVRVRTNATGGSFQLQVRIACAPVNALASLDGTVPAEGGAAA